MDVSSFLSKEGQIFAFEIENICISLKKISFLLSTVSGVTHIRVRRLFSGESDIHMRFNYNGQEFIVWEPYGDSSVYWIGPENKTNEHVIHVDELEKVFREYQPIFIVRLIGDLISFKFLKILK